MASRTDNVTRHEKYVIFKCDQHRLLYKEENEYDDSGKTFDCRFCSMDRRVDALVRMRGQTGGGRRFSITISRGNSQAHGRAFCFAIFKPDQKLDPAAGYVHQHQQDL